MTLRRTYSRALPVLFTLTALTPFAPACSSTPHEVPAEAGVTPTPTPTGTGTANPPPVDGGHEASTPGGDGGTIDAPPPEPVTPTGKLDLLFMIDNSASMADKQEILRKSAVDLVARLVNPLCLDAASKVVGQSTNGVCATGKVEFKPLTDIHIGVISSSLGGRGSDQCNAAATNPNNPALNAHNDDGAHLLSRGGADEHAVAAAANGFLTWAPSTVGASTASLLADFQDIVAGVHEFGCGYEAQLESVYRFLIQPDPALTVARDAGFPNKVQLSGVDETILAQRAAFLRPDSTVAVVLLTDENDSTVDPLSINGQGWAYENSTFPGSPTGSAAMGTPECATAPTSIACTSCGFVQATPQCATRYLADADDSLNLRFFQQKRRFGVDPQFPLARYVTGLSSRHVPNRDGEHPTDASGTILNYANHLNCVNPLFAAHLPTKATDELCNLTPGTRSTGQVFFALIGGVPHALLSSDGTATGALKPQLSAADWQKVLGRDPLAYDFAGADPHMLEATEPRAGLPGPTAANDADPIHGREWDTARKDLQYACTFALPAPKDCTAPTNRNSCDCDGNKSSPVCSASSSTTQVRGKAYPSLRELAVAKAMGPQAIVASVCPVHTLETTPGDPLFGYRPAIDALVTKLRPTLEK